MARPENPVEYTSTGELYRGSLIRELRRKKGLSLKRMAKLLGCDPDSLSKVETNGVNPSQQMLSKIAEVLEVPLEHLTKAPEHSRILRKGVQPAPRQQTQKTATPDTRLNSLLTTSPQEVLKHRLAMLEMRLEAAEKNLHEAHEELRELGALAGQDQRPSFAKRLYSQITGPASEVQSFFDEVEAGKHPDLKVAIAPRESSSMFSRQRHGYEARLSGAVEFTGHVSEKFAHDYVKSLIETRFPQTRIEVKVSEDVTSL